LDPESSSLRARESPRNVEPRVGIANLHARLAKGSPGDVGRERPEVE
jgi:hypothetical protein